MQVCARGEGLITHHHRRVSKERARDRHALLLPAAQQQPFLANLRGAKGTKVGVRAKAKGGWAGW